MTMTTELRVHRDSYNSPCLRSRLEVTPYPHANLVKLKLNDNDREIEVRLDELIYVLNFVPHDDNP